MKKIFTILLINLAACFSIYAQTVAPFKAGDRVAFVGNSITDGGHYHSYIWLYYMTHFPNMRITCFNVGIGGDAIGQINTRFDDDALSKNPTVLTLTWGMNDTGYFEWYRADAQDFMDKRIGDSYKTYALVEDKLKQRPEIRKIIILGSPYDETTKFTTKNIYPKKTALFSKVIDFQQDAAKKNNWGIVDFYHPMTAINLREQAKDTTFSLAPNDRVHPDNDGHLVMAYLFLKTQGLDNKAVADIAINAESKKVTKSVNCRISNVMASADSLSFNYLANSLPYPIDTIPRSWGNKKKQADALKLVPFTKEFNQEILTVKGLKAGNYNLMIDGERIATYAAQNFSDGVNMAELTRTPQYQQAIQIRELNEERWEIERRLRMYMWMEYDFLKGKNMLYKDNNAAMDTISKYAVKDVFVNGNKDNYTRARYKSVRETWQKEMNVIIDEIYAINKPQTHRITIAAAK
ncbi:SGNH/GDSL hydrolase family protein [Mucilaginibacter sp. BJC16-A38]|uniref:SGNH/GDSL hydrolase family protein n=1 Tax=Mucilaginibacter phenanthrenivorans TaxID=1234842 RepID=UPI0021586673|nr:SGNH/GDSL hydrolase family protein [Mucilaginibacter phenanthrenivorans]MCR8559561.1 SGNH/GDSL hydrolase family protein [Mucilaginibacter phenanthrenivorans]